VKEEAKKEKKLKELAESTPEQILELKFAQIAEKWSTKNGLTPGAARGHSKPSDGKKKKKMHQTSAAPPSSGGKGKGKGSKGSNGAKGAGKGNGQKGGKNGSKSGGKGFWKGGGKGK
jgi:hypothetical protein